MCTVPPAASQIFGFGVRRQNGRPRAPAAVRQGCKGWDDASSHSLDWLRWPWPSPKRSKLVHTARRSQILKFRQIWARSRASADPNAPHDPDSDPKGYPGTDHTQGIPEQPEITRDCSISQNGRVHKVFGDMGGRRGSRVLTSSAGAVSRAPRPVVGRHPSARHRARLQVVAWLGLGSGEG